MTLGYVMVTSFHFAISFIVMCLNQITVLISAERKPSSASLVYVVDEVMSDHCFTIALMMLCSVLWHSVGGCDRHGLAFGIVTGIQWHSQDF